MIKILLDKGCEIDAKEKRGSTALHCAAQHSHPFAVKLLLQKGAFVDTTNNVSSLLFYFPLPIKFELLYNTKRTFS